MADSGSIRAPLTLLLILVNVFLFGAVAQLLIMSYSCTEEDSLPRRSSSKREVQDLIDILEPSARRVKDDQSVDETGEVRNLMGYKIVVCIPLFVSLTILSFRLVRRGEVPFLASFSCFSLPSFSRVGQLRGSARNRIVDFLMGDGDDEYEAGAQNGRDTSPVATGNASYRNPHGRQSRRRFVCCGGDEEDNERAHAADVVADEEAPAAASGESPDSVLLSMMPSFGPVRAEALCVPLTAQGLAQGVCFFLSVCVTLVGTWVIGQCVVPHR